MKPTKEWEQVKIRITAQYYENYADNPEHNSYWKAKGSQIFEIMVPMACLVYETEKFESVLAKMVRGMSNCRAKYEFRSYEIQWHTPFVIEPEVFNEYWEKEYEG